MAKKNDSMKSVLLVGAVGAGLWWLFSGSSASAATPTLGAAAQGYLNQIMAIQTQMLNGAMTQAAYNTQAMALLVSATSDARVSIPELNYLHGVAGV